MPSQAEKLGRFGIKMIPNPDNNQNTRGFQNVWDELLAQITATKSQEGCCPASESGRRCWRDGVIQHPVHGPLEYSAKAKLHGIYYIPMRCITGIRFLNG